MPKFSLQSQQSVARALLLFGVLAGLLFSCGEGIRLFPFPLAETARNTNFRRHNEGQIAYQKNAHRFENKQENQSKAQRHQPPHWTDVSCPESFSPFAASQAFLKTDYSFDFRLNKLIEIARSRASRAPPVPEFL